MRALLLGGSDPGSVLSKLDLDTLRHVYSFVRAWWKEHVVRDGGVYASIVYSPVYAPMEAAVVDFPEPKGWCVNMMPVRMGDISSVPEELRDYHQLLLACPAWMAPHEQRGGRPTGLRGSRSHRIGYLTVHESRCEYDGASQRRPGLHTETPGYLHRPGQLRTEAPEGSAAGAGGTWAPPASPGATTVAWGGGFCEERGREAEAERIYHGGIYMASTVAGSTRVWNAKIERPGEVVRELGDIEHLRPLLGEGTALGAGELAWITDATPHESLPLAAGQYRQYFRLVTSEVSVWYSKHSTPNPKGILPGEGVLIIDDDKFAGTAAPSTGTAKLQRFPVVFEGAHEQHDQAVAARAAAAGTATAWAAAAEEVDQIAEGVARL